jgi:hypothetical protein
MRADHRDTPTRCSFSVFPLEGRRAELVQVGGSHKKTSALFRLTGCKLRPPQTPKSHVTQKTSLPR